MKSRLSTAILLAFMAAATAEDPACAPIERPDREAAEPSMPPHRLGITQDDILKMEEVIPEGCTFPIPNYRDREFWDHFPVSDFIRKRAEQKLNSVLPEMSVALWEAARQDTYREGARGKWAEAQKELGRVLDSCTIMECKENRGRFGPRIIEALEKLLCSPWG